MTTDRHHDRFEPVVAEIRKTKCTQIRCVLGDESPKVIAISKARNKWDQLARILDATPWDRIECLDAKGAILGVVENDDDIEAGYDDEEPSSSGDHKLAKTMFALMRATMAETRKMYQAHLDGTARLVETLSESVHSLQQTYELAMRVQIAQTAAQGGDSTEVLDMMKMVLPMLPAMMSNRQPQPPKRQMRLPHVPPKPTTQPTTQPAGAGHP